MSPEHSKPQYALGLSTSLSSLSSSSAVTTSSVFLKASLSLSSVVNTGPLLFDGG